MIVKYSLHLRTKFHGIELEFISVTNFIQFVSPQLVVFTNQVVLESSK